MITSTKNSTIKEIILLQSKKKERDKKGLFVIEGLRAVSEIPNNWLVDKYIVSESFTWDLSNIIKDSKAEIIYVKNKVFKSISDTKTPQGIMAIVYKKDYELDKIVSKDNGFYIIGDSIQDPGNLGSLIRTAHAAGVDGVFLSKGCADIYNPKTVRATMGSIFHIALFDNMKIEEVTASLRDHKVNIYATALEDSRQIYDYDYRDKTAIIIGNEANGISDETKALVNKFIRIPMPGGSESLNASIAAGISMYEVVRQRMM